MPKKKESQTQKKLREGGKKENKKRVEEDSVGRSGPQWKL